MQQEIRFNNTNDLTISKHIHSLQIHENSVLPISFVVLITIFSEIVHLFDYVNYSENLASYPALRISLLAFTPPHAPVLPFPPPRKMAIIAK